ncbi:MAG: hypothetical protein JWO95_2265, partial [Verrucomicrobiales bacterium]|nr:hypothetical protein [Verrucomicrobiales bacterium]
CVRAIIKQSDGTYVSGEWGSSSWPVVTIRGKAVNPTNAIAVLTGTTQITIGKGPDYLPQTITTNLSQANVTNTINVTLQPQLDFFSRGWRGGDAHLHYYHGENEVTHTPSEVFTMCAAGGMTFASLAEEHYGAVTLTRQQMFDVWKPYDNSECKIWDGIEEPKNQWGHHIAILYDPWSIRSAIPYPWGVYNVHEQGGVSYPVHPDRFFPARLYNGQYAAYPINNHFKDFPIEALAGHLLDAFSGVSDEPYKPINLTSYLKLLSLGYKIPLLCDSDFCFDRANNGNKGLGLWMNFFQLEGNPVSRAAICNAIRKGRVMCTTGPMVAFSIDNAISGDTLPADGAQHTLRIEASYKFNPWTLGSTTFDGTVPTKIVTIDLIRNGQVVQTWNVNNPTALIQTTVSETTNVSYMVRVAGNETIWVAAYASPIYFENTPRPRQPPVFKSLVQGKIYDCKTGTALAANVACVRYGVTNWTITTAANGLFRAYVPIDADLIATDSTGRCFTQNLLKFEPAYSFCHYLPDNYPDDKGPAVDAFSNLVQQLTYEFPIGLQLASSYVRTNLASDLAFTNIAILSAPAATAGKTTTEIVRLMVDKTQVQPGDTINYVAIFRQPQNLTPTERLSIVWNGWNPNNPHINTKYQYSFGENSGTSGTSIGNGFWMRSGSVVVPNWVTNDTSTTAAIDMFVRVIGSVSESAHLLIRVGPTKRELLVTSTSDGFPATWGQIGIGPCNAYRDDPNTRYADYRSLSVRLTYNGQLTTITPLTDTAHVADADNAVFYENFYYDGNCEPQYRNIVFRDAIRTQPAPPNFTAVPIQNPSDTTPPNVVLMEPFNGDQIQGPQARLFYFVDDVGLSGVKNADIIIDGSVRVAGTTSNPVLLNLTSGAHTWQVRGYDNAGNSALSEIRTMSVVNGISPPTATTLKNFSINGQNQFVFKFDSVAGANYTVQSSVDTSNWPTLKLTNAATTSVNVTDQISSVTRIYRVLSTP